MDKVMLRVRPNVGLPHTVLIAGETYVFGPEASVPKDWAESKLKDQPHIYELSKGATDLSLYKWKSEYKKKTLAEVVDNLSDEDQGKVLEFAEELLEAGKDGEELTPETESAQSEAPPKAKKKGKKKR